MNDLVNDSNGGTESPVAVMTKAEFARYRRAAFGVGSKSLISKYLSQGKIAPPALRGDGRIDRVLADAQLAQTVAAPKRPGPASALAESSALPEDAGEVGPPVSGTLAAEQIALARARRIRIELETEKEAGRLVSKIEMERETFSAARQVRDRLLAVPGRIAAELVGKDERQIAAAVRDALTAALNDAADDLEQSAPDADAPGPRGC